MEDVLRSFVTLKEMLSDRNVDISNLNTISDVELGIMVRNNKIFSIQVNDDMSIIYYMNSKFKINDLKKYFTNMKKVIIIFKDKINNLNIKNLKEYDDIQIEIFLMKELQFNISKHVLVPKHTILNDEDDIQDVLNTFQLKNKSQLPIILKTDAMARYLNMKTGDIVKIVRKSPSAGEAVIYRYCV